MFSRLREDIACILERDPAARSTWEVLTCYPGLHALVLHRRAHWFWQRGWRWAGRFTSHVARFLTGIEIHPGATIGRACLHRPRHGRGGRRDGRDRRRLHHLPGRDAGRHLAHQGCQAPPDAGAGVIVGANSQVLGGFTVGDGARIGSARWSSSRCRRGHGGGQPGAHHPADAEAAREAAAAKMGFSAYGVTQGDDPVSQAMKGLIDNAVGPRAPDRAAVAGHREAVGPRARTAGRRLRAAGRADHRDLRRRAPEPAGEVTRPARRSGGRAGRCADFGLKALHTARRSRCRARR
jgi:serine O-acetyltransferase